MRQLNMCAKIVGCLLLCSALCSPIAQADEDPPVMVQAPQLEIQVTPVTGTAPLDVEFQVTNVFHPFDVYEVSCSLVRDNNDDIHVHPRYFELTEEGSFRTPWYEQIYLTEPGRYILYASISHNGIPENLENRNWEYESGGVFELQIELNYSLADIKIPEPRPIQNFGYQQPYPPAPAQLDPNAPVCVYSIYPLEGQVPFELEANLGGSYSPLGNSISMYSVTSIVAVDGYPADPQGKEEYSGEVSPQDFDDPQNRIPLHPDAYVTLGSTGPVFKYQALEPGCYLIGVMATDSADVDSKIWFEYVNALGPGQQPPVATLVSYPDRVELEEITLLQYVVDAGGDPDSVRGRENELIRVKPRGAVAVTFDASPSRDPDGYIAHYYWDVYNEGEFNYTTFDDPKLTLYVDENEWPTTGLSVDVLVVDNDGYVDTENLIVGVEQELPFGVTSDVPVMQPGEDDDMYSVLGYPAG